MKKTPTALVLVAGILLSLMGGSQVFAKDVTINIALANNPISQAMERITREKYSAPGVTVNIAVLPENDLRQKQTPKRRPEGRPMICSI